MLRVQGRETATDFMIEVAINEKCIVLNLSENGACILLNALLQPGYIFELKIPLPKEEINCQARVVWSSPEGNFFMTGLEFIGLSEEDKKRIDSIETRN